MNNYRQITKEDIPCEAYHKELGYSKVYIEKGVDGKVYYKYTDKLLTHHERWANIKHFVIKID